MQNKYIFPLAAVAVSVGSAFMIRRFGISVMGVRSVLLWVLLLAAAVSDCLTYQIPDRIHVMGIMLYFLTVSAEAEPVKAAIRGVLFAALLSGGLMFLSLFMEHKTGKESLGGGDIKLFFMTGLYLKSVWEILFYVNLSCFFGLIMAIFRKAERIPFAPAIAAALFCMLLYGDIWTKWYMTLF